MDRVVIIGGGFAGLNAAKELAGKPVDVTVVDRHNYHLFQPLLYQVATAGLEPQGIAKSIRGILHDAGNVNFRMGTATGVDWDQRLLLMDSGEPLAFDYLVVAAGATTKTLGIPGVLEHAYPLKTLDDAVTLRDHILSMFEQSDVDPDVIDGGALTFVVVGAGPTGVELSGALIELLDHVLRNDYPAIDLDRARIVMVEALPTVLSGYKEASSEYARHTLEERGVELLLDSRLSEIRADRVLLDDGAVVPTRTVIWAAGVQAHPLADALGLEQVSSGRIRVGDDLSVPGRPDVFVIGDIAGATAPDGTLYPQLAPVAIQQGRHVAHVIGARRAGRPSKPFSYTDKGTLATIGRNAAVAEFGPGLRLSGRLAWLSWLIVHLMYLVGYRNRAVVLLNWIYNYVTYDRAARLIIRAESPPRRTAGEEADRARAG